MKKKLVIGAAVGLVTILIAGVIIYSSAKPNTLNLKGVKVAKEGIGEEIYATGRLELRDKQEISPPFAGKVKLINVKVGDQVQEGQTLLEMDTEDLKKQIGNARISLAGAKADLDQGRISRSYTLEDTKRAMEEAEAALKSLTGPEGKPLDMEKYALAKSNYDKAKINYDRLTSNPAGTGQVSLASLENRVKQAELTLNQLLNQLNSAVVKAPISGTVTSVAAVNGSASGAMTGTQGLGSTALITIGDLSKLRVKVKVNEIDSVKVKAGQKVRITGDAFDKEYSGNVESVAPVAVTSTGARGEETTVEVMVAVDDATGLRPGYNVNAGIKINEKAEALVVPLEAVTERGGKKVVFVEDAGQLQQNEVTVGLSGEKYTEVVSGVKEGDMVVLSPGVNLKQGDKVKIDE